jgi:hypothetical protein
MHSADRQTISDASSSPHGLRRRTGCRPNDDAVVVAQHGPPDRNRLRSGFIERDAGVTMARVAPQLNANDYLASGSSGRRLTTGILTGTFVKRTPEITGRTERFLMC